MFSRTGILTLLALTSGAIIVSSSVWAGFSSAFQVSGPFAVCRFTNPATVAIDGAGDTVFSWMQNPGGGPNLRVQARTRSAAGVFGPILNVSALSVISPDPDLAIDNSGNALIAWDLRTASGPSHAQFRVLSATGQLGPITNLSRVLPIQNPKVAMNAQGKAIFVWVRPNESQGTFVVEARTRSRAGTLGPIQRISLAGQKNGSPKVAMSAGGEAVFTWVRQIGSDNMVEARRRAATGELGLFRHNIGKAPGGLQVAVAANGDAVITWTETSTSGIRVVMRSLSAANRLGPRQAISQGSQPAILRQMSMNRAGDAVFGFVQGEQNFGAKARFRSAAGVFTASETVRRGGDLPAAGIDNEGRSVFAWTQREGDTSRIEARTRSAIGDFGPVRVISSASTLSAVQPSISMNARGMAAVVWCEADEEGINRIFGATFTP